MIIFVSVFVYILLCVMLGAVLNNYTTHNSIGWMIFLTPVAGAIVTLLIDIAFYTKVRTEAGLKKTPEPDHPLTNEEADEAVKL